MKKARKPCFDIRFLSLLQAPASGSCFRLLLQADSEVVLAAVQKDLRALRFAGTSCKDDKDIVLIAVQQSWQALKFAGDSCKDNKETLLRWISVGLGDGV